MRLLFILLLPTLCLHAQAEDRDVVVSGAATPQAAPRTLVQGSFLFANIAGLKDAAVEKARLAAVLTGHGAKNVQWREGESSSAGGRPVRGDRIYFTDLDVAFIPQIITEMEYKPDPEAPGGRMRMHELLECRVDGVLRTTDIRAAIETIISFKVTPGAKLFYVPSPAEGEQEVRVSDDGSVRFKVRLQKGQEFIFARSQLGAVSRYIRVSIFEETTTDVSEDEYRQGVAAGAAYKPAQPSEEATRSAGPTPQSEQAWLRPGTRAGEEIIGPDGSVMVWVAAGEEIVGPDGGVMVWVPPGEFTMGSADDDGEADDDERPAHRVRITKGFWLGKCEVTNAQYAAFLNAYGKLKDGQGHEMIDLSDSDCGVEAVGNGFRAKAGRERHPVVLVTWYSAKAYCEYYGLALPTEAQWEYAARGPEGRRYPWGNAWDAKKCCNDDNRGTGYPPTMEVGSLPGGNSWCGAAHLAGNVWEWCADWYDEGYYNRSPAEDPTGPTSGGGRLLRGGSWGSNPVNCRAADRYWGYPESRLFNLGFRACRTFQ